MSDQKLSSHLPDLVDLYIATRARRLALEKEVVPIETLEKDLAKLIIAKYRAEGVFVLGASNGVVKMTAHTEPVVTDWNAFYSYIKEHDDFSLLHKRVTATAVKERWEAGEEIPGVGSTEEFKLSVSKA